MTINKSYWKYKGIIQVSLKEKEDNLKYEILDMFRNTYKNFYNWDILSQFQQNLLVESLAIHTRTLVDFFYKNRLNPNDIIAQDFMPKGIKWIQERPKLTQALYDAREKANKQLAHLSSWRVKLEKDGKKPWDKKIEQDLENVIEVFENLTNIKF